jgi:hypothetical protein
MAIECAGCCISLLYRPTREDKNAVKERLTLILALYSWVLGTSPAKEEIYVSLSEKEPHKAATSEIAVPDEAQAEKVNHWSAADKRMLIIGFCGGLAANIGVVLVIGAAIVVDRFITSKSRSISS